MSLDEPKNCSLNLVARMRPGLTTESLKPRLPALAQRLDAIQPSDATGKRELQVQGAFSF
jgi:hypothetical protein